MAERWSNSEAVEQHRYDAGRRTQTVDSAERACVLPPFTQLTRRMPKSGTRNAISRANCVRNSVVFASPI